MKIHKPPRSLGWPFSEVGRWQGRSWRWEGPALSTEQARKLASFQGWTWTADELDEGRFRFTLTRTGPEDDEPPYPRKANRWRAA